MKRSLALALAVVFADSLEERIPFISRQTIFHEDTRTVLVPKILSVLPDSFPMLMRNYFRNGNIVFLHQKRGEPGRLVEGFLNGIALVLAHFNADGIEIARSVVVGMAPLFVGGQRLKNGFFVDCVMPG